MKKAPIKKVQEQEPTKKSLSTSEIDLTQLTPRDLVTLRARIDEALVQCLPTPGKYDIVLDYNLRLRTSEGIVTTHEGSAKLASVLHPRMLPDAPRRFEQEFMQNLYAPINAEAFDLFDNYNPTSNSLEPIFTHVPRLETSPGLPIPPIPIT